MASPATASPRKGVKWNNVFGSGHRRSSSMSGLSKINVVAASRSTSSLGMASSREADTPASTISPNYTQPIAEEHEESYDSTASVSPKSSAAMSPPPRPRPAPRLWTEPSPTDSLPGLESVIAPRPVLFAAAQSPRVQSPDLLSSGGSEAYANVSKFPSNPSGRSLSMRRKGSLAELDLRRATRQMAFVPDTIIDSRTFLPHPEEEVLTQRTATLADQAFKSSSRRTPRTPAINRDCPTPRAVASDPQLTETRQDLEPSLMTPVWDEKSQRRASSMLLPSNLAPLVLSSTIPREAAVILSEPTQVRAQPAQRSPAGSAIAKQDIARLNEQPPRVPPKSPRTLMRAFPAPRPGVTSSGTPSTAHTANSSISSITPIETPIIALTNAVWSPREHIPSPPPPTTPNLSPLMQPDESLEQLDSKSEDVTKASKSEVGVTKKDQSPAPDRPLVLQILNSVRPTRSDSLPIEVDFKAASPEFDHLASQHQRMVSESSVMNRGRPMKRGDVSLQRSVSRGLKMAFINGSFPELPKGYKKGQVNEAIDNEELRGLHRDAEEQVLDYKVLTQLQIANLNQELRLLDENCDHIRQTIAGLREGRKALLRSMRLYLNAPGNALSLRDQIVKQEVALSDIDDSVDDWTMKLEAAINRKQLVQLKLSEHVAAVLALSNSAIEGQRLSKEHTPPRSPERGPLETDAKVATEAPNSLEGRDGRGRDVESIRIYADEGVASLLRSIEQEIDMMDQLRTGSIYGQ